MSNGNDWNSGNGNGWEQGSGQPSEQGGGDWGQSPDQGAGSPGQFGSQPAGGGQSAGGGQGEQGGWSGGGGQGAGGAGGAGGGGGGGGWDGMPPAGGGQYPQPPETNGPGADMLTEGWGGGPEVTSDEVIDRLKLVFKRATQGSILKAWLMVGAALLAFQLIGSVFYILNYFIDNSIASTVLGIGDSAIEWLASPLSAAVYAFQLALFKPLHREIFEGAGASGGPQDALGEAKGIFWYMLAASLLLSLVSGFGLFCCIAPGLFLGFMFCQAPYLTATQDIDPITAFKSSFFLNKTYWMVILAAVVGMIIAGIAASAVGGIGTFIIGLVSTVLHPFNVPFLRIIFWLGIQLGMFGVFVVNAAVFSVIESKETGKVPA